MCEIVCAWTDNNTLHQAHIIQHHTDLIEPCKDEFCSPKFEKAVTASRGEGGECMKNVHFIIESAMKICYVY